ncbi:uncharacterized protein PITG_17024 [Phytophthora infestans T30-4]|uniref:Protein kinase domain-containing protein n=1 Tax=Phytophthora infestans (strain T30-4) TaxID=403677 RepID=D0NUM0_PHYIT|nr:uncharacterized protein PITG_17024 [Phytophthora infestans T30-4]EEY65366.1 conserved hypothetical protein [Phytophthora infestans T30-4]|eukprot:XP_002897229.1 conserved hypothetical protein [Phytophthora infestans T30-4]
MRIPSSLGERQKLKVFLAPVESSRFCALRAKPTLAVYAENRTAAPFNASEVQAETTYTLLLSTICDLIGSAGSNRAEEIVLVMPQLPGITLLQFLRQSRRDNGRRLSEEEGWRLLARLAEILQTVHQSGIVHCDLNLENVMVSLDLSRVWLIDFGAAYNLLDVQHNQQMTGTPGFVAPERVLDPLVPPTPKTDVFSLAVNLPRDQNCTLSRHI